MPSRISISRLKYNDLPELFERNILADESFLFTSEGIIISDHLSSLFGNSTDCISMRYGEMSSANSATSANSGIGYSFIATGLTQLL